MSGSTDYGCRWNGRTEENFNRRYFTGKWRNPVEWEEDRDSEKWQDCSNPGTYYKNYEAIKTALSDNDTAINKNLAENESNGKVTGLTYTITCTVSDTQTLTVKLDINYPVHRQDAFYKIKQWKLNTDTAFEENDTLNLIGGN